MPKGLSPGPRHFSSSGRSCRLPPPQGFASSVAVLALVTQLHQLGDEGWKQGKEEGSLRLPPPLILVHNLTLSNCFAYSEICPQPKPHEKASFDTPIRSHRSSNMSTLPEQQPPPRASNEELPRDSISRDGSAEQSATPQPLAAQPAMDSAESTERLDAVLYSDASRPRIAKSMHHANM